MLPISLFQKRLRNLTEITIRNINFTHESTNAQDSLVYFTLSTHNDIVYRSEVNDYSVKSVWQILNNRKFADLSNIFVSLAVFAKSRIDTSFVMQFTRDVDFSELVFIGDEAQCNRLTYSDNTFLFHLRSGYYVLPSEILSERRFAFELNSLIMRQSYKVELLQRIQIVKNALKDSQKSLSHLSGDIDCETVKCSHSRLKQSQMESLACKIGLLTNEIAKRKVAIVLDQHAANQIEHSNTTIVNYLVSKKKTLKIDKSKIQKLSDDYFKTWDSLLQTNGRLLIRRKQLISELRYFYPIDESGSANSSSSPANKMLSILHLPLPRPETMSGSEEAMFCVAIGYVCHLVAMIARFLDVPLRYSVCSAGSRSHITDEAFDKLNDNERTFPLYCKGKEKIQYEYAVYLLDKNIAQIRYYVGLGTGDLRKTLQNIQHLLLSKLTDYSINRDIRTLKDIAYRSSSDDDYRIKPDRTM